MQWNHSDLSRCAPKAGACWAVTRKKEWAELSKAEEPVDRHWTVTVVGLIRFEKKSSETDKGTLTR